MQLNNQNFLILNSNKDWLITFEKNNEDFSNRGFIHFRAAKSITNKIDLEGYIQNEINHFINLENRELIGGGFRINQYKNMYLGLGHVGILDIKEGKAQSWIVSIEDQQIYEPGF